LAALKSLVPRGRKKKDAKPKSPAHSLIEFVVIVAVALGLAILIQAFVVKPFRIPSGSMEPTLDVGQRVLVNRLSHRLGSDPKVGDVVVFHPPRGAQPDKSGLEVGGEGAGECAVRDNIQIGEPCPKTVGGEWSDENYIKRVVGVPGDTIAVRAGRVIRNGQPTREPFISSTCDGQGSGNNPCTLPKAIKVPAGQYYMMGDNRGESNDSRFWGPVPRSSIVGNAFATYWPPKKIGGL
jgi:signal peptidase I